MLKRAAILADTKVQDEEYVYPYYRLLEAGFKVDVVTVSEQQVYGKYGVPVRTTMKPQDLKSNQFDLVFVPGGMESPEKMRQSKHVLNFIKDMYNEGKVVSAICHGPWVLISAEILKGKKATCFPGIKDDLINAGGIHTEEDVVVDGNVVTSPHYRHNPEFMKEVLNTYEKYCLSNLVLA